MANGDIRYAGPKLPDAALITRDEIDSGKVKVPPGMTTYTVEHGDNLTSIASTHGYGNPPDMDAFYKDNPQYAQRNPDLIYPGEVVLVKEGKPQAGQAGSPEATDKAATDLAAAQKAQKDAGGAPSTDQYHSEQVSKAETAFQQAAQAEIAAGGSADAIIARNGGANADPKLTIAARRAETDQATKELVAAKASGEGVEQAQAFLDSAVKKEIEASATLFADGNSREAIGKGAVAAGESIKERLEKAGLNEEANRVDGISAQVQQHIENEDGTQGTNGTGGTTPQASLTGDPKATDQAITAYNKTFKEVFDRDGTVGIVASNSPLRPVQDKLESAVTSELLAAASAAKHSGADGSVIDPAAINKAIDNARDAIIARHPNDPGIQQIVNEQAKALTSNPQTSLLVP